MTKVRNAAYVLLGVAIAIVGQAVGQDWYQATGKPVQRSLLNSADLRSEFSLIEQNIAAKLPPLAGNGGRVVVVNQGGTALEVLASGVPIAGGGTGASTASGARANLGLEIGSDVQAYSPMLNAISSLPPTVGNFIVGTGATWTTANGAAARAVMGLGTLSTLSSINNANWSGTDLTVSNGGTGASDAAGARANLGLIIGTNVQAYDPDLSAIAALSPASGNFIVGNGTSWTAQSGATVRTSLGLGALAGLNTINNTNWSGTALSIANGGTGATTATSARSNLGLGALATANTINNGNWSGTALSVANGGTGATSASAARSNLGLGTLATLSTINNANWSGTDLAVTNGGTGASNAADARANLGLTIGSDVQAYSTHLNAIAGLSRTDGNFIVANGTTWVAESGSTARASLGLGSLATLSTINNSNWSGTDLAIANGGTGASDAATARSNLGAAAASHNHSASDITSGTLPVNRGGTGQTTMDNLSEQVVLQWTIASDPGGTPSGQPGDVFAYY